MNRNKYIYQEQEKIFRIITKQFKDYYLTGGTALAFYFNHRYSEDLDFFSQNYRKDAVKKIMELMANKTGYTYELQAEQNDPKFVPISIFGVKLKKDIILKIDFVQDPHKNINKVKKGMHSVDDIYCRKIQITIDPAKIFIDETGREMSGSRQKAKDVFDLYYLSENYKPLSEFAPRYFSAKQISVMENWFRSLDKQDIKLDIADEIPHADAREVFEHLDNQVFKNLKKI